MGLKNSNKRPSFYFLPLPPTTASATSEKSDKNYFAVDPIRPRSSLPFRQFPLIRELTRELPISDGHWGSEGGKRYEKQTNKNEPSAYRRRRGRHRCVKRTKPQKFRRTPLLWTADLIWTLRRALVVWSPLMKVAFSFPRSSCFHLSSSTLELARSPPTFFAGPVMFFILPLFFFFFPFLFFLPRSSLSVSTPVSVALFE